MVDTVIGVSDLVKNYPDHPAVCGVSFQVRRGEIFALLGPNGAGKTTIVQLLQFTKEPTRGFVYVLDSEAVYYSTGSYRGVKEKLGVLPQGFSGFDMLTVFENVDYFARMYPKHVDIDALIRQVALVEKRNTLFRNLSGGEKQRVGIAAALVNDPEVLFLDEPTTGLDPRIRREVWEAIKGLKARGKTVLLTTHYMDEAQYLADRVCILNKGKIIAQGTPEDLINSFGGGNTLVIRECAKTAADRLVAAFPGCRAQDGDVVINLPDGDSIDVVARAAAIVSGTPPGCRELFVKKATLDDVFINLTGEKIETENG